MKQCIAVFARFFSFTGAQLLYSGYFPLLLGYSDKADINMKKCFSTFKLFDVRNPASVCVRDHMCAVLQIVISY